MNSNYKKIPKALQKVIAQLSTKSTRKKKNNLMNKSEVCNSKEKTFSQPRPDYEKKLSIYRAS